MKRIVLIISIINFVFNVKAQDKKIDSLKTIKIEIVKDKRIDKLRMTYTSTFKLKGYRIQIYSGNKKQPARQARMQFSNLYRKIKAYEIYEQPYFKVRVGNFKTQIEALKFKNELVKHFPNCIIVKDELEFEN